MNRTMAAKHDKAKREGMKATMENAFAFMAVRSNMAESALWMMNHKPCYTLSRR